METGCAFLEGIQAWGGVKGGLKRHQAAKERIEVFGITQTGLESHFGHLAV